MRKDVGGTSTEYLYFRGQAIAELDVTSGNWSDYVFAGGKRIARAVTVEHQLHISGQICSNCGWQWYQFNFTNLNGLAGRVIQAGDTLRWVQWSGGGSRGGLVITFTDGTESWMAGQDLVDQHGEEIMRGSLSSNQWEYRIANFSPVVNKTISQVRLYADGQSTPGQWDLYFQDLVFTGADGTVIPLFSQNPTVPGLSGFGSSGMTQTSATINNCALPSCTPAAVNATTYYHGDHLSSSRLLTDGYGYPIWQGTFLPFGEEYNAQLTTNHYKFTDKEQDSESGLDFFGARFYGPTLGRFVSSDLKLVPALRRRQDPQQLNLYSYVRNNPLRLIDPDGKELKLAPGQSQQEIDATINYLAKQYQSSHYRDTILLAKSSPIQNTVGFADLPQQNANFLNPGENQLRAKVDQNGNLIPSETTNKIQFDRKLMPHVLDPDGVVRHELSHTFDINNDLAGTIKDIQQADAAGVESQTEIRAQQALEGPPPPTDIDIDTAEQDVRILLDQPHDPVPFTSEVEGPPREPK